MVTKKIIRGIFFFISFYFVENSLASSLISPVIVQQPADYSSPYGVDPNSIPIVKNISSDNIKYTNAQNLRDVLQGQMGLQLSDLYGDGSRTTVSLRGFGDNAFSNTIVLVDGLPWFNPDEGNIDLNIIPLEQIDKIEIIPSSDSVLYGDAAVGGVVNIITKKAVAKTRSITAKYDSFNGRQISSLFSDIFANHFGYSVNAQHSSSDNYRQRNASQTNNINLLLNYANDDIDGYLRYIRFNQRVQMPGSLTKDKADADPRQYDNNASASQEDTDYWQVQLRKTFANGAEFKLLSSVTQTMEHNALAAHSGKPWVFTEQRTAINLAPQVSWLFNLGNFSVKPLVGAFAQWGDFQVAEKGWNSQRSSAIYSAITTYFTPKLSLLYGARLARAEYDLRSTNTANNSFKNTATVTTVTLNYAATKNLSVFFKRASSYRFPKVDEEVDLLTSLPAPLKTQYGVSYEVGLNYTQAAISLLLEAYQLKLKNEIVSIPLVSGSFVANENLDPTLRNGVLLDVSWLARKWLQLHSSINYVKAKFVEGPYQNNDMPFVAHLTYNLGATFMWRERWRFMIEDIYTGQRYPINDVENRTAPLAAVSIYNCSLSYETPHYLFSWRINNFTNKHYYNHVVATYTGDNISAYYYPAAGISTMVSVTVKF